MYSEREKGIALVIVLGLLLLLVIAAVSFMLTSLSEIKMVRGQNRSTKAFYLAEAGIGQARIQLDQDWSNRSAISSTPLGDGNYSAIIYTTDSGGVALPADKLRVKATGNVNGTSRAVEVVLEFVGGGISGITHAITSQGTLNIGGSAENGITPTGSYSGGEETLTFQSVFGITKAEMEQLALDYFPDTHYNTAIHDDPVTGLTWVNGGVNLSQLTSGSWSGDGILIVNGDLNISGGTFEGIIWVAGNMNMMTGSPEITGALFVECDSTSTTSILGNPTITFSTTAIDEASLPPIIESWREASQ